MDLFMMAYISSPQETASVSPAKIFLLEGAEIDSRSSAAHQKKMNSVNTAMETTIGFRERACSKGDSGGQ